MYEIKIFGLQPYAASQEQLERTYEALERNGWTIQQVLKGNSEVPAIFRVIPEANYKPCELPTYLVCTRPVQDNGDPK